MKNWEQLDKEYGDLLDKVLGLDIHPEKITFTNLPNFVLLLEKKDKLFKEFWENIQSEAYDEGWNNCANEGYSNPNIKSDDEIAFEHLPTIDV